MISSLKPALGWLRPEGGLPRPKPEFWRNLLPLVLLAIGITALVSLFLWRDQASYKPVFGSRENVAVADMVSVLDAAGIAYRVHPDSGQLLVPEGKLGQVRMLLASKGVVAKLPEGLELMDRNDPLGVSQFVQDVRFRRGLEGELRQSIMSLDAVAAARVHLSIARSSSFVLAEGDKSSASVMLTLKAGRTLNPEQIAAIINLVANSVANLDPRKVSVVDQAGNYLSARVDPVEGFEGGVVSDAAKHYQDETRRNVDALLAPVLGNGNYRASVTAEVDNDKVQETVERYGEAPRLTNEAVRTEAGRNPLALGVPGSLSNRPVAVNTPEGEEPEGNTSQRNAHTRQYAYDRSVTQTQRARGRLNKLSVAVVLNSAAAPGGKAWEPAAIANVEKLLRSGLGIDATRGDRLTVSALPFPAPVAAVPWWQERENVVEMGSWAAYALAALLAFLFIVRPVLRLARQAIAPDAPREVVDLQEVPRPIPPGPPTDIHAPALGAPEATATPEGGNAVTSLLEDYDLPPAGSPVDVMVDHLRVLASKEPERVAEVVKQWVNRHGRPE
ncbi:MAG: flagellar M-ring protein FliF [Candidatus Dactylopiibacterium carminicum]|uniref:Flagellar M-ring protein n=1 Tax=Candidatus Dactylopiibacterium carminicum TaxID=857335 RepID=A0A272EWF0_9RHOO|nr:flagellar basal-body MS-ring/collar protein FliF [Candidatus Dactylopiibacterium carminicum]KAF7599972.1 flagellar M-ring protein FliF [Candidatus Dactylopiibacterium carminicum]PAS94447.1 MAG: flagellar M-ring protein FliF [Candidatus Dactylopiibacterium carminicum]PAS99975.1 MAG: flagellar M-ring protein FliF [Candidatus Dactylopiibacterium carminicum]